LADGINFNVLVVLRPSIVTYREKEKETRKMFSSFQSRVDLGGWKW
jgi:hypothetical protein